MPHLSIQGHNGVIGHHQAGVSVVKIVKIFNFKRSIYELIDKYMYKKIRALTNVSDQWLR